VDNEIVIKQLAIIINLLERICYKMGIEVKRKEELMNEKIELGAIVTDTITGFTGVVVSRIDYLEGTSRLQVQQVSLKDGAMVEAPWIEEGRLKVG